MVMRRGDARHKDVPDPLEAGPKRITTIHAQRKFAQGSGMNSPVMSPLKEKEKAKVNGGAAESSSSTSPSTSGLPAKRPRTEDFITFLCYRGTPYLPSELNHFNVPSKPDKNDREASSSKQTISPSRQQDKEEKLSRAKQKKRLAVQAKSKVLNQRQRKSRLNAVAKQGKVFKSIAQTSVPKDRLKKAAAATVGTGRGNLKGRPPVVRASHPAILKRLGASRARIGLRSGGQPPSGSDAGIKTDRKSRPENIRTPKAKSKLPAATRSKGKIVLPSRLQGKRSVKSPLAPSALSVKAGKVLKETPKNKAHPKSLTLATRPSRKTKEAAALYMEMITKDLRSPDEEDDLGPLVGPKDVDFHSTPVKTRTRSGGAEDGCANSASSPKKKAGSASSSNLTTNPLRRSLKQSGGRSLKRAIKEEEPNKGVHKDISVRERHARKCASDDKPARSPPKAEKTFKKTSQIADSEDVVGSSHSEEEEDDDDKSILIAAKKSKKGVKSPKTDKPISTKKPIQKSGAPKKAAAKVSDKSAKVRAESDQSKKRSTRSGGPQETVEVEKDRKLVRKGKARGSNKKEDGSESEADEDERKKSKTTRSSVKKEDLDSCREAEIDPVGKSFSRGRSGAKDNEGNDKPSKRVRAKAAKTVKADSEYDSEEDYQRLAKTASTLSRASPKETPDEKEKPHQRQPQAAKSANIKVEDDESEYEADYVPVKKVGRPKKTTDETKPAGPREKRASRKSQASIDEKSTRSTNKVQAKSGESEDESEGELNGQTIARRTRTSKAECVDDSKADSKPKRGRFPATQLGKLEDSGSEDVPSKKSKRASKPEVKNAPEPEDITPKSAALRNSALKSNGEKGGTQKDREELKEVVKTESGGVCDQGATPAKVGKNQKTDDTVVNETVKPLEKVEAKEAPPKRSSRSGPIPEVEFSDAKENPLPPAGRVIKEAPVQAKRGRKPKKVQESETKEVGNLSDGKTSVEDKTVRELSKRGRKPKVDTAKDKKEVARPTKSSGVEDVMKEVSSPDRRAVTKQQDQTKKSSKKADAKCSDKGEKSDSESQKHAHAPARRGRKPKKVEESEESDEEKPERKTRPRRSTRAVVKRESYSEFSGEDLDETDDESDYDGATPRKTRGRKSNVKYTERDTDDSLSAESQTEMRPRRSRRSIFSTTLAINLDSDVDEDFLEEFPSEKPKDDEVEESKPKTQKESKAPSRKASVRPEENASIEADDTISPSKPSEKVDDGEASDSSKTAKPSVKPGNAGEPAAKAYLPDKKQVPAKDTNAVTAKDLKKTMADSKPTERPESVDETNARSKDDPPERSIVGTAGFEILNVTEMKRVTRRLSRDKPETVEPLKVEVKSETVLEKPLAHQSMARNFDLAAPSKEYDNNNGLAILSDVAFSELQNRKNIMRRKLSSDSATSFSSDEVPSLPVRKDKVLPKAKADLPTVREKTESDDDDLSDDLDDDSPFNEYRKRDKLRRKRLPKRTRREATRQISQRPVRNRTHASYIDDESFSSDRSTSPEIPVKTAQKKRKSEDKPTEMLMLASKPPVPSVPMMATGAPASVPKTPEEPVPPSEPKESKLSSLPKMDLPKMSSVQRNDDVRKPVPKSIPSDQILSIPRPPQSNQSHMAKLNNDTVTLFSGVSGLQVTMSDARLTPVQPHREIDPQISQPRSLEALAKPPPYVPTRSGVSCGQFPKSPFKTDVTISSTEVKAKPSNLDTWKNAFINAKIPKPGQLSPAHHSTAGTPFMRKTFSSSPKTPTKPEEKPVAFVPTKLPGVQTFKTSAFQKLGKLGNQSPNRMSGGMSPGRPPVSSLVEPKPLVYLSPSRVKNSPSKDDRVEPKKLSETPKSLTLLQYEKRSQEVVSSLKGSQPVLVDGVQSYIPAFPTKLKEYSMEKAKTTQARQQVHPVPEETAKPESGKHTNLPFAVDSALRKRSPITVKKPVKVEKKAVPTITIPEVSPAPAVPRLPETSASVVASPTAKLELLSKKKVQMTNEEIKKWLDDSTSTGVEHAKDCGIFENNQCECSYRTSGESMLNSSVGTIKEDPKIDHGVVEPPVQLKELDSEAKFTAETISTCKVEDYKEKLLLKSPVAQAESGKELIPPVPKVKKPTNLTVNKSKRKNSMTEDEMCEYGFRFERNAHSSRESGSDMSSPTPRDDVSSSNEEKFDCSPGERKSIFLQRRQKSPALAPVPRKPLSKSPCAFSAENESSVYAFEDAPPLAVSNPFRRRGSRHKSSEDDGPASSSIAVQVNLETAVTGDSEQVLECSTQTEQVDSEGQLFYFPLEGDANNQEVIQGVQVKLQSSEGPEQKVIMKAKLVTKPSATSTPSTIPVRPLGDAGRALQRPEQKVRPLATTSTSTQSRPPVGTVTPTVREPPGASVSVNSQGTATDDRPELMNQSTQAAALPQTVPPPSPQQPVPTPDPATADPCPALAPKPSPKSTPTTSASRRSSPNEFPLPGTAPRMVEALTFYPSEKEFQDPLEYIERITLQAQTFGICRIVPPSNFKPECKVSDDMRFTAYNQYVHKMLYRWGPNVREMTAIKKYLATQSIALKQLPYIGGMEIDLPRLYQTVQSCGGLKEVIEKKRWAKVADMMKIPKAAQDRVTKLDDLYCKYLLPYDTLSHAERSKLLEEVDMEWTERERRIALEAERESKGEKEEKEENSESEDESDDGRDECITKGKTMPLSGFYRVARNTMAMWFKEPNPSSKEVENEYWKQVTSRKQHVCVFSGSIDSGSYGYGFPTSKSSSTSRHPWNLKVLTNNPGSILRSMGPVMGVTVPTLHVGMLFSACCWYRDPHGLPWIEYLHTGANKIWYAVPDLWNEELHGAMRTILPRYCQDKPIWLASDTAMVPPDLLVQQGVSLCRAVQEPGQFILVFPKAFTSTICTGYSVSESVYFAQPSWLNNAKQIFKDIQDSCEPPVFSLERLLFNIATDARSTAEVLTQVLPMVIELRDLEVRHREQLKELGVTDTERLAVSKGGRKRSQEEPEEYECEVCRGNLYLSLVTNTVEEANFCLQHAVETLTKDRTHVKNCKLMYSYDEEEMDEVVEKIKQRIETKTFKKQNSKPTGGSSKV